MTQAEARAEMVWKIRFAQSAIVSAQDHIDCNCDPILADLNEAVELLHEVVAEL